MAPVSLDTASQNGSVDKQAPTLTELNDILDSLWTSYLNFLDAYTSAQKVLQKHMSAGYLSLAKANFHARDGIRRYGEDYYHERAIATKRAAISRKNEESTSSVTITPWNPPKTEPEKDSEAAIQSEKTAGEEENVNQLPSPPGTPEPETRESEPAEENDPPEEAFQKLALESDPLRWYGILIPPPLRSAQASFSAAVDKAVAEGVNAARGMRNTEAEIRRLRKEIKRAEKHAPVQS